jgi:hypothetical protein
MLDVDFESFEDIDQSLEPGDDLLPKFLERTRLCLCVEHGLDRSPGPASQARRFLL